MIEITVLLGLVRANLLGFPFDLSQSPVQKVEWHVGFDSVTRLICSVILGDNGASQILLAHTYTKQAASTGSHDI